MLATNREYKLTDIYKDAISEADLRIDYFDLSYNSNRDSKLFHTYQTFDMLPEYYEYGNATVGVYAYFDKESRYYRNPELLKTIKELFRGLMIKLNDDGTTALVTTNFHTVDQFGLSSLGSACNRFLINELNDDEKEVFEYALDYFRKASEGFMNSGFHTPNHRWVETAAMLAVYNLTKDERLIEKSNKYLAEGVDCDEYGEWSERSSGMYNIHCDREMITIYLLTKDKQYLDAVCRNLDLMYYYFDPDMSMFSQNSRRTDKGERGDDPLFLKATTYYAYLYMMQYLAAGYLTNNLKFAKIALRLLKQYESNPNFAFPGLTLSYYDLIPGLKEWNPDLSGVELEGQFEIYQPKSNIVRRKTETATYSLLAGNPSFLQISANGMHIDVRMCASFFACAQFIPRKLEKTEDGYRMAIRAHAEYKQPLDDPDESCKDYWSIDPKRRKPIQQLDMDMVLNVTFDGDKTVLGISTFGEKCDKVPFKLEFIVNPGLHAITDDIALITTAGGNMFVRKGTITLDSVNGISATIENLNCEHMYAVNMRGSLGAVGGAFTIYSTSFTPIEQKVVLTLSKRDGVISFN